MHLLYADESGSVGDPDQRFFVLGGVSVHESVAQKIEADLSRIAQRFSSQDPYTVEFHGSPMLKGVKRWRGVPLEARRRAMVDAMQEGIVRRHPRHVRLFAAVLDKKRFSGRDIAQLAFEQLSSRFDQFLARLYKEGRDHHGLILFDKSSVETRIQTLAREFRQTGHSLGVTRNFADVPVFLDSKASRLVQLADLACYATFRFHEHGDATLYKVIRHCFDSEGGVQHGLYVR